MAGFETAIAHENEIMKAQDVAFGYDAAISNIGSALKAILGNHAGDYVIGGFVKPFGTDTLQIAVEAAFIFCQSTGLCAAETDMTAPISLESADATFDRIDVVQVHAFKTEFSQQSRMFNDPISGIKRLRTVPTKKRIQFDVQIKKGANGSESAPKTDEGFVKLAEIRIPAGTQNLTAEMIRNVEARKSGGVNTLWTEDKTRTFNPGSLTDVFSTFLIAHNEDGSHKAKAIKKEHIDFGTSGDQIKGSDIPTGKSVRVHKKDFSQIADLTSVITALAESSNALPAYANDILSRYSYVSLLPVAASTAPIDIKGGGEKTIDGVACKAGMSVFLKDQTDARENGLYIVKAGAWARAAGFTEGRSFIHQLIFIPAGTVNKGKIFYLDADFITLGQDTLDFKASALSPYALANTIMTRDKDGRAKVAAPNAADDIARKAEVDAEARTRADAVGREANARTDADLAEMNARIAADRSLAETRMTRTQCEDIARSAVGTIPLAGQGDYNDKDKNKGLGLVKTANRTPNMQEASKNESWAASPNWVFNLITGNCEAELKKHIINAMRSGVKSDPDVFCYRGIVKPDELDKTITSGIYQVYYGTYGGALLVFNMSGSVGIVQFLKPDWNAAAHWQYRNAIDSDTHRWTRWQTIATTEDMSQYIPNFIKDFGDPTGKHAIQVGFAGNGLAAENTSHLVGFYDDHKGDRGNKIRDISKQEARKWLGIEDSKDDVLVENAGWKAVIRPCQNGVELAIMDGMNRNQLWTRIAGGVMSLFVLGSITSCGGMYKGDTGAVKNGWEKMNSNTTNDLYSVACNGNTWVAVGFNGTILASTDNGNTWSTKKNTGYSLSSVAYNDNTWIAVGTRGTMEISTDNGNTWSTKKNTGYSLSSVACNGNTWVAVGSDGTILRSSDTAVWE